jgi:hypothetical protein
MRVLVFVLISFCAGAQVRGIESVDTMYAYDMYNCGCLAAVYDNFEKDYDLMMSFDSDYVSVGLNELNIVYGKLVSILDSNGVSISSPSYSFSSLDFPDISVIKKQFKSGYVSESRFKYNINDMIVSFVYSSTQIQLFIYKNHAF